MKINGSLVFDASSASVIENLRVQRYAGTAVPAPGAADVGRLIYVTTGGSVGGTTYTASTMYFGTASAWIPIATGGDAASLQNEVNAIEVSLGAGIKSDGTFDAAGFPTVANVLTSPTSFTNAINQIASAVNANNELSELDDVALVAAADGDFLRYNGSKWVDSTISLSTDLGITTTAAKINQIGTATFTESDLNKLNAVTAAAADLNLLAGASAGTGAFADAAVSSTELSYLDGVTSKIQTQLNDKQTLDATLTALAGLNGTAGFVVQTGADAFTKRELVAPAAGITITHPAGTAGNPTFALANDLAALEGLETTGIIVRTGDGTATTRTITGTSGRIVVTAGSGVGGEPTLDLATVEQASSGGFVKVTLDGYGRVTGNTAVTLTDIKGLADGEYVNVAGDTMTGNLVMGTNYVTMTNAPTQDTHAANKAYVDARVAGLSWKQAVRAATTTNITLAPAPATVDGVTLVSGDRVLVKAQTAKSANGIYTFNGTDLVRATDMDAAAEFAGATVYVTEGSSNADSGWTQTKEVVTVGTTDVEWYQFSGSSTYVWGDGLSASGNIISVNMGAGIKILPSDEVGIDVIADKAVQLTSTDTGGQLTFVLDTGSGMEQSASGLKISAGGVTNAMLANSGVSVTADTGSSTLSLGNTLHIDGDSVKGVSVDVSKSSSTVTYAVTVADASYSQKGVATFNTASFTVTDGDVTIKNAGVSNTQLANSTVSFTGTNATTDAVSLGGTVVLSSTVTGLVSAAVSNDAIAFDVRKATTGATGVAQFSDQFFSVADGVVSLAATLDDLTNVSSADNATTGDLLTKTAGDWQPVSRATMLGTQVLDDIGDVAVGAAADGEVLVRNGSSQWVNQKVYHLETVSAAATTWTVPHGLGVKYCNVTIIDTEDEVVIPQSIKFDSTTQLTVTFNTAIAGKVVVMGIA